MDGKEFLERRVVTALGLVACAGMSALTFALFKTFPRLRKRFALGMIGVGILCMLPMALLIWGVAGSTDMIGPGLATLFFFGFAVLGCGAGWLIYAERERRGEGGNRLMSDD